MSDGITEHNLFRPKASKAETKADVTNHAARAIIGAEAERREAKTARLRQARMEAEAKLAASAEAVDEKRREKRAAPRRKSSSS